MITNRDEAFEKITEFVYQSMATKILNALGYTLEELSAVEKWNRATEGLRGIVYEEGNAMRDELLARAEKAEAERDTLKARIAEELR